MFHISCLVIFNAKQRRTGIKFVYGITQDCLKKQAYI